MKNKLFLIFFTVIQSRSLEASFFKDTSFIAPVAIACMPSLAAGAQYAFNGLKPYANLYYKSALEGAKKAAFIGAKTTVKGAYNGALVIGRGIVVLDEGIQTVLDYSAKKISQLPHSTALKKESGLLLIGAGAAGAIAYLYKDSFKNMSAVSKYSLLSVVGISQYAYSRYCLKRDELVDHFNSEIKFKKNTVQVQQDLLRKERFYKQFSESPDGKKFERFKSSPWIYDSLSSVFCWLDKHKPKNKNSVPKSKNSAIEKKIEANKGSSWLDSYAIAFAATTVCFLGFGYSKKAALLAGICVGDHFNSVLQNNNLMENKYNAHFKKDTTKFPLLPVALNTALTAGLAYGLMSKNKAGDEQGIIFLMGLVGAHSYYKHKTYSYVEALNVKK